MADDKTKDKAPLDTVNNPITKDTMRQLIKATVAKMGSKLTKDEKIEHAKLLVKIFEGGMSPKEAMAIKDEDLASMYSFGYSLANAGKYKEAREMFKYLYMLEPTRADFATALGVCHHQLKDYEYAANAYMVAFALNFEDPVPLFYAYDCFLNLNDTLGASIMLKSAIEKAGDEEKYAKMKEKAQALLDGLKNMKPGQKKKAPVPTEIPVQSMQG